MCSFPKLLQEIFLHWNYTKHKPLPAWQVCRSELERNVFTLTGDTLVFQAQIVIEPLYNTIHEQNVKLYGNIHIQYKKHGGYVIRNEIIFWFHILKSGHFLNTLSYLVSIRFITTQSSLISFFFKTNHVVNGIKSTNYYVGKNIFKIQLIHPIVRTCVPSPVWVWGSLTFL